MAKHGQKTRILKGSMRPSWRHAWQVVVDLGTDNTTGRLKERYTWQYNKYELHYNEVAGVGAGVLILDFKPVPKHAGGGGHDIKLTCRGYYTGNHAAPQAPHFQIYDNNLVDWTDIAGMVFSTGGSGYELLEGRVPFNADYWDGDNNVRIRIAHPVVGGNPTHEFHINHVTLGMYGTTTTSTTSTSSTTTTV